MKNVMINITEDEFFEKYKPIKNHINLNAAFDGCMFETYGDEINFVFNVLKSDNKNVWTIIESDDTIYYISGYHLVNRFGYLITEESVPEGLEISVVLDMNND